MPEVAVRLGSSQFLDRHLRERRRRGVRATRPALAEAEVVRGGPPQATMIEERRSGSVLGAGLRALSSREWRAAGDRAQEPGQSRLCGRGECLHRGGRRRRPGMRSGCSIPIRFPSPTPSRRSCAGNRRATTASSAASSSSTASGLVQTWGGLRWFPLLGRGRLLGYNEQPDVTPDIAGGRAAHRICLRRLDVRDARVCRERSAAWTRTSSSMTRMWSGACAAARSGSATRTTRWFTISTVPPRARRRRRRRRARGSTST